MKTIVRIYSSEKYSNKEVEHEDLLPCPFCGEKDIYVGIESSMSYHCKCTKCGARTRPVCVPNIWNSKKCLESSLILKAVKFWNKRAKIKK
jgi:hypothetical protein